MHCETISGKRIDFLKPHNATIHLFDIAAGLARLCHFSGQSRWHQLYSVAAHAINGTLLLLDPHNPILPQKAAGNINRLALLFLLHPAPLAYTGVLHPTLKSLVPNLAIIENRIKNSIYHGLRIKPPTKEEDLLVSQVKTQLLKQEKTLIQQKQGINHLHCYSIQDAEAKWLGLYWELKFSGKEHEKEQRKAPKRLHIDNFLAPSRLCVTSEMPANMAVAHQF